MSTIKDEEIIHQNYENLSIPWKVKKEPLMDVSYGVPCMNIMEINVSSVSHRHTFQLRHCKINFSILSFK